MQEDDRCVAAVKARLDAYGFGEMPGLDKNELIRRRRIALGVIVAVMGLVTITNLSMGHATPFVLFKIAFVAIELPLLVFFVSIAYDYALRNRLAPLSSLMVTGAASILVGTTSSVAFYLIASRFPVLVAAFPPGVFRFGVWSAMLLGVMLGTVHLGIYALAFVYPFAAHDARVRALEAERLRTVAELARLRGHLEPHFLLNTLNAIAGLVTEDPREARRLLAALGDLLRDALKDGDEMQTLEQEEGFLRRYAEILESRHKGSLDFEWDIAPEVRGILIPRMLLQPLVENAVKHGALRRRSGGKVTVHAERSASGERVICVVADNGPGFTDGPIRQGAIGLSVVRKRLELKFEHADFRIESSTDGTRAIVEIDAPGRTARAPKPVAGQEQAPA